MAQAPQVNIGQINMAARAAVLTQAVEMKQQIFSTTIANPGNAGSNVVNVIPRNVGLIKRFVVQVTASLTNTGAATPANDATPTQFGAANILSQIVFNDLNNNVRINTTGWHADFIASAKRRRPWAMGYTPSTSQTTAINFAPNNFNNIISATSPILGANGTGTVNMVYDIPLAYTDDDLRGAIYANVVNATMNLQLTINGTPFIATGTDATLAVYTGAAVAGTITSITITVFQIYLDQLPVGKNGPVLPILDLSTIYELKNTSLTGIQAAQDFPIQYANFRDFLSTIAIYDLAGTLDNFGADINYWALLSANFTQLFNVNPKFAAMESRNEIGTDWPRGVYYFNHRRKPISTLQYGNMQLVLNAKNAPANSSVLIGYEDFALVNSISQAGSLAAS